MVWVETKSEKNLNAIIIDHSMSLINQASPLWLGPRLHVHVHIEAIHVIVVGWEEKFVSILRLYCMDDYLCNQDTLVV